MERPLRIALSVALVVLGLAVAVFYYLLFAITDCSPDCVAAGERAVPVAFVGAGLGAVVAGALWFRGPGRRAAGWGIATAGLVTAVGSILLFAEGSAGLARWIFVGGLLALLAGGFLRRAAHRAA